MPSLIKAINMLRGKVDICESLIINKSPLLLHISDTPSQFYPELKRIIKVLKPKYIIHTGDLADNIKCELRPSLLVKYRHEVKKLLKILKESDAEKIYLALGNHDDFDFIKAHKGRLDICKDVCELSFDNINKLLFSHYPDGMKKNESDIYLFGHDIEPESSVSDSYISLNGINSINIINLDTLEIHFIAYPMGTDDARLNKNKIGI